MLTEFLMQPEATTGTSQPGEAPSSPHPPSTGFGAEMQFLLLPLMLGLFYFLMIRPQQKRQRETDDMLKALKRGDMVRTSGGIRGEVTDFTDTEVTLLIADKVKVNVLKANVASKIVADAKEKS